MLPPPFSPARENGRLWSRLAGQSCGVPSPQAGGKPGEATSPGTGSRLPLRLPAHLDGTGAPVAPPRAYPTQASSVAAASRCGVAGRLGASGAREDRGAHRDRRRAPGARHCAETDARSTTWPGPPAAPALAVPRGINDQRDGRRTQRCPNFRILRDPLGTRPPGKHDKRRATTSE